MKTQRPVSRLFFLSALFFLPALRAVEAPARYPDFLERFAFAGEGRAKLAAEYMPGAQESYRYQTLDAQNRGALDEAARLLDAWEARYPQGRDPSWRTMLFRQRLLEWPGRAGRTLDFLAREFDVRLSHPRPGAPAGAHPSALDPGLVSERHFIEKALRRPGREFEPGALALFAGRPDLPPDAAAAVLGLIPRAGSADAAGVTELLLKNQADGKRAVPLGPILPFLTPAQLDRLRAARPDVAAGRAFAAAYLRTLLPSAETDLDADDAERRAWQARTLAFARTLPPPMKHVLAGALYAALEEGRRAGEYDPALFREYLALPVRRARMNAAYLGRPEVRRLASAAWGAPPAADIPALTPPADDEPLVADFLDHLLADAESPAAFADILERSYIERAFIRAKLTAGRGDAAALGRRLSPAEYRELKDRVEIAWLPTNPAHIPGDAPVALDVRVKNAGLLRVSLYDIDAEAACRANGGRLPDVLPLDGCVPTAARVIDCSAEPPLRRKTLHLAFPEASRPGVYMVECAGGGLCARAVVRKGALSASSRPAAAGIAVTVRGDGGEIRRDAALWLDGRRFAADEDGEILVPFAPAAPARRRTTVVSSGRLAAPFTFLHLPERYSLGLTLLLDRESLLPGADAEAILHPSLRGPGGAPLSLALLERPALTVTLTDRDGNTTVDRATPPALSDADALTRRFRVPPRLRSAAFELSGEVRGLALGRPIPLSASQTIAFETPAPAFPGAFPGPFPANAATDDPDPDPDPGAACPCPAPAGLVFDAFLRRTDAGYAVELRDLAGGPLANRAARFTFLPRLFRGSESATLQSDAAGVIRLGPLDAIRALSVSCGGRRRFWELGDDADGLPPPAMNAAAGEAFTLPALGARPGELRRRVSLLARNAAGAFTADALGHVSCEDGALRIAGLPPGDYRLFYRERGAEVALRVTAPLLEDAAALAGRRRALERAPAAALLIRSIERRDGRVRIRLSGATPAARVHLFARRFRLPGVPAALSRPSAAAADPRPAALCSYLDARRLGDEERYVMDRRGAGGRIGILLPRPGALLTPWSREQTRSRKNRLETGTSFKSRDKSDTDACAAPESLPGPSAGAAAPACPAPDFLPAPAAAVANLRPDADGIVTVDDAFAGRQELCAVAVDGDARARLRAAGPAAPFTPRDLRLAAALPDGRAFTERIMQTGLSAGAEVTLERGRDALWRAYPTLESVRRLFQAFSKVPELETFAFIAEWAALGPERKRELYGKYACHELDFFLYCRDRPFFDEVVAPNLRCKRVKRFLDAWLLGEDLSPWRGPAARARLNALEKALLGRRLDSRGRADTAREFADICALQKPDPAADERALNIALGNGAPPPDTDADAEACAGIAADAGIAAYGNRAAGNRAAGGPLPLSPAPAAGMPRVLSLGMSRAAPARLAAQAAKRARARRLYQPPGRTKEWRETDYWKTAPDEARPDRIPVNRFWRDFAAAEPDGAFSSEHVMDAAAGGFTERMAALALLDVPFAGTPPEAREENGRLVIRAASPALLFLRETVPAAPAGDSEGLAIVERFYNPADAARIENGVRIEKFERDEFLTETAYGSRIVVMNPTARERFVRVLRQIPQGAVPLAGGRATSGAPLLVPPYATRRIEGPRFFFPRPSVPGAPFPHYAARLSAGGRALARAEPLSFRVSEKPSREDPSDWRRIADSGPAAGVLAFLERQNLRAPGVDLSRIAWRMGDKAFFTAALAALDRRGLYDRTLWGYALKHNDPVRIRQFLERAGAARMCGPAFSSPLFSVDPERDGLFEHCEYRPLVNNRAHPVGGGFFIADESLARRYRAFLETVAHRPAPSSDDRLLETVYLLAQGRDAEAAAHFALVKRNEVAAKIQTDYAAAWLAFARGRPAAAAAIAEPYRGYAVPFWRGRFRALLAQAAELAGNAAGPGTAGTAGLAGTGPAAATPEGGFEDAAAANEAGAAEAPLLALSVRDGGRIRISSRNVNACTLRLHPVDIEMLFSKNPFPGDPGGAGEAFTAVRPAAALDVPLGPGDREKTVELPAAFRSRSVLVEAAGDGGAARARALSAPKAFTARTSPAYGRVLAARPGGRPFPGVYVKVYARCEDGRVRFHKDGYTDLRGIFDYASVTSPSPSRPKLFSILLLSPENASEIITAPAP